MKVERSANLGRLLGSLALLAGLAPPGPAQAPSGAFVTNLGGGCGPCLSPLQAAASVGACGAWEVGFSVPATISGGASLFLVVGASNPLIDLGALFPGCSLLVSPDVLLPLAPGPGPGCGFSGSCLYCGGGFIASVPVPCAPALVGGTAYAQGADLNPSGLQLSNALAVTLY